MQRWGGRKLSALIVRLSSCDSRDDIELSRIAVAEDPVSGKIRSLILANLLVFSISFHNIVNIVFTYFFFVS